MTSNMKLKCCVIHSILRRQQYCSGFWGSNCSF